jgi:hypothetical protein
MMLMDHDRERQAVEVTDSPEKSGPREVANVPRGADGTSSGRKRPW